MNMKGFRTAVAAGAISVMLAVTGCQQFADNTQNAANDTTRNARRVVTDTYGSRYTTGNVRNNARSISRNAAREATRNTTRNTTGKTTRNAVKNTTRNTTGAYSRERAATGTANRYGSSAVTTNRSRNITTIGNTGRSGLVNTDNQGRRLTGNRVTGRVNPAPYSQQFSNPYGTSRTGNAVSINRSTNRTGSPFGDFNKDRAYSGVRTRGTAGQSRNTANEGSVVRKSFTEGTNTSVNTGNAANTRTADTNETSKGATANSLAHNVKKNSVNNKKAASTAKEKVNRTSKRTAKSTANKTTGTAVNRTANNTVNNTVNRTANNTVNKSVKRAANRTTGTTVNRTANNTVNNTVNRTAGTTVNNTVNKTANSKVNRTAHNTAQTGATLGKFGVNSSDLVQRGFNLNTAQNTGNTTNRTRSTGASINRANSDSHNTTGMNARFVEGGVRNANTGANNLNSYYSTRNTGRGRSTATAAQPVIRRKVTNVSDGMGRTRTAMSQTALTNGGEGAYLTNDASVSRSAARSYTRNTRNTRSGNANDIVYNNTILNNDMLGNRYGTDNLTIGNTYRNADLRNDYYTSGAYGDIYGYYNNRYGSYNDYDRYNNYSDTYGMNRYGTYYGSGYNRSYSVNRTGLNNTGSATSSYTGGTRGIGYNTTGSYYR